jgi:hypothetical protein
MLPHWRGNPMKKRIALPVLGVALLLCGVLDAQYMFRSYSAPKNGHGLQLTGINNAGRMVGFYYAGPYDNDERAVVVYPSGFAQITIAGGTNIIPGSINKYNEISGWVYQIGRLRGFIRFQNLSIRTYDISGASSTMARGINDYGMTGGTYQKYGIWLGFTRLRSGSITTLRYPGAIQTWVRGINNTGQGVGQYFDGATFRGFLYNKATNEYLSIEVPGSTDTICPAINNKGEILGQYISAELNGFGRGFLLKEGVYTTIDTTMAIR